MAITTPAELEAALGNWLDRSDLTNRLPEFISLFEARANREIRTPDMLTRDDLATVDSQFETLPAGYLETARYTLLTTPIRRLDYLTPEELSERRERHTGSGTPSAFTVIGDSFEFYPTPADTYAGSHLYYTALDLSTTNWLLTDHPDVCLFGALCEAEAYVMNDERIPVWQAKLERAMQSLRTSGERKAVPTTPRPRVRSF